MRENENIVIETRIVQLLLLDMIFEWHGEITLTLEISDLFVLYRRHHRSAVVVIVGVARHYMRFFFVVFCNKFNLELRAPGLLAPFILNVGSARLLWRIMQHKKWNLADRLKSVDGSIA